MLLAGGVKPQKPAGCAPPLAALEGEEQPNANANSKSNGQQREDGPAGDGQSAPVQAGGIVALAAGRAVRLELSIRIHASFLRHYAVVVSRGYGSSR